MAARDVDGYLEHWQMNAKDLRRRMILAQTPRERERWYAMLLLAQGWTASATAEALERDPRTIGRWGAAFGPEGPTGQSRLDPFYRSSPYECCLEPQSRRPEPAVRSKTLPFTTITIPERALSQGF